MKNLLLSTCLFWPMLCLGETQFIDNQRSVGTSSYGLGLALLSEDEGYKGMEREMEISPVPYIESDRFRLMALQGEYKVLRGDKWSLGAHMETRMDGFEKGESNFLNGMEEREATFYGGVNLRYQTRIGQFSSKFLQDIGDTHDGSRAALEYRLPLKFGRGLLTPWLEVEYYGDDMTQYYYGVRPEEATALRPLYQPDAAVNFDLGVDYQYLLGEHHSFLFSAKYRHFSSEIADSPIVADDGSARVILGYIYRF